MAKLNARTVAVLSLCLGLLVFAGEPVAAKGPYGGRGGGKKQQEDDAIARYTVKQVVDQAIHDNPGVGAALIRLVFHDCWVHGCDGSVLLDGNQAEKQAKNNIGLAGFDVIDNIKKKLGDDFSCADIVVLAAREATINLGGGELDYPVKIGREDGLVSSAADADAVLPHSTFDITQLKKNFLAKGFNTRELTALSGAHSIGICRKSSFKDRLNDTTATPIDGRYLKALRDDVESKTTAAVPDPIEPLNIRDKEESFRNASGYDATGVDTKATGRLDNSYYHANSQLMVLLKSDWELLTDSVSGKAVQDFMDIDEWHKEFRSAMAKLSELRPPVGDRLETRKDCRKINGY